MFKEAHLQLSVNLIYDMNISIRRREMMLTKLFPASIMSDYDYSVQIYCQLLILLESGSFLCIFCTKFLYIQQYVSVAKYWLNSRLLGVMKQISNAFLMYAASAFSSLVVPMATRQYGWPLLCSEQVTFLEHFSVLLDICHVSAKLKKLISLRHLIMFPS